MNLILRAQLSRLGQMIVIALVATFMVFCLLQLTPGDPAVALAGEHATPERLEEIRQHYGFDQPIIVQYMWWLGRALTGDLSRSLLSNEDVFRILLKQYPNTLIVAIIATVMSLLIGLPLGILAARRPFTASDALATSVASVGIATPNFWLAMILVSIFALQLGWLPATGMVPPWSHPLASLRHLILPATAVAFAGTAIIIRQLRGALIEVLSSQYVRTLRAKGMPQSAIIWRHGLKNVSTKMLTVTGLVFNHLLGATVVVETVFAIPGAGTAVTYAVVNKDFPVVQGVVLAMVITVVIVNLVVDMLCAWLDPRISIAA